MRAAFGLLIMLVLACSRGFAATPPASGESSKSLPEYFADLSLGFCASVVSHPDQSVENVAAMTPGIELAGPEPLARAGAWSDHLQGRLEAKPDTPVYVAKTAATYVDAFHVAYLLADGSRCIALAQEIDGALALVLSRIKADASYQLMVEAPGSQLYGRAARDGAGSYIVMLRTQPKKHEVENVYFERRHIPAQVADADREAWAHSVFDACLQAAQQGRTVTVADFGRFMELKPSKRGGEPSISAPQGYPSALLLPQEKPAGCMFMLAGGATENPKVSALWHARLQELDARSQYSAKGEGFLIEKSAAQNAAAVSVEFNDIMGILSVKIVRH